MLTTCPSTILNCGLANDRAMASTITMLFDSNRVIMNPFMSITPADIEAVTGFGIRTVHRAATKSGAKGLAATYIS